MRAVDTNVLVRHIVRDDLDQLAAAEAFIEPGAWVSLLVLIEATWVWSSVYGIERRQVIGTLEMLLQHQQFVLQDADVVSAALELFRARPALKFSDCLILEVARRGNYLPLGTFDRDLGKVAGAQRL
jgi:predicted nucleic-acid-binding protein